MSDRLEDLLGRIEDPGLREEIERELERHGELDREGSSIAREFYKMWQEVLEIQKQAPQLPPIYPQDPFPSSAKPETCRPIWVVPTDNTAPATLPDGPWQDPNGTAGNPDGYQDSTTGDRIRVTWGTTTSSDTISLT